MSVKILQPSEGHEHPALDVGLLNDQVLVPYHCLKIGVKVLQDQVYILLHREDVAQLFTVNKLVAELLCYVPLLYSDGAVPAKT